MSNENKFENEVLNNEKNIEDILNKSFSYNEIKREVTKIEFSKFKEDILAFHNPDTIPVFNPEWKPFSLSQRKEIEDILRWGKGIESYVEKRNDLYRKAVRGYVLG